MLLVGLVALVLGMDAIRSGLREYGSDSGLYIGVPLSFLGFVLTWVGIITAGVSLGNDKNLK